MKVYPEWSLFSEWVTIIMVSYLLQYIPDTLGQLHNLPTPTYVLIEGFHCILVCVIGDLYHIKFGIDTWYNTFIQYLPGINCFIAEIFYKMASAICRVHQVMFMIATGD